MPELNNINSNNNLVRKAQVKKKKDSLTDINKKMLEEDVIQKELKNKELKKKLPQPAEVLGRSQVKHRNIKNIKNDVKKDIALFKANQKVIEFTDNVFEIIMNKSIREGLSKSEAYKKACQVSCALAKELL